MSNGVLANYNQHRKLNINYSLNIKLNILIKQEHRHTAHIMGNDYNGPNNNILCDMIYGPF